MAYVPSTVTEYGNKKEILMFPNDFSGYPNTFQPDDPAAVTENGKSIIKAGTVYPANDSNAKGVVLYDCDVTDGTATGTVVYSGAVLVPKIPEEPTESAKAALPRITWFYQLTE